MKTYTPKEIYELVAPIVIELAHETKMTEVCGSIEDAGSTEAWLERVMAAADALELHATYEVSKLIGQQQRRVRWLYREESKRRGNEERARQEAASIERQLNYEAAGAS